MGATEPPSQSPKLLYTTLSPTFYQIYLNDIKTTVKTDSIKYIFFFNKIYHWFFEKTTNIIYKTFYALSKRCIYILNSIALDLKSKKP